MILCFCTMVQYQWGVNTLRDLVFFCWTLWNIIGAHLNIINENVGVVDRGGQVVRKLHLSINNELDMMSAWWKLKRCREIPRCVAVRSLRLAGVLRVWKEPKSRRRCMLIEGRCRFQDKNTTAEIEATTYSLFKRNFLLHPAKVPVTYTLSPPCFHCNSIGTVPPGGCS